VFAGLIALVLPFITQGQTTNLNEFFAPLFTDKLLVWSAETNGFRTGLRFDYHSHEIGVWVLSSTYTGLYIYPPGGKIPRVELRDTNNTMVQPIKNKMDGEMPQKLPTSALRKYSGGWFNFMGGGVPYDYFGVMKGEPNILKTFLFDDAWKIENEADYSLTAFPIIYKIETNGEFADRIDFPVVTTIIHFSPLHASVTH
jgi:hypothetical protein